MKLEELPKDSIVFLLDADPISYAISHEMKNWKDNVELATSLIDDYMHKLYSTIGCSHIAGFVGGDSNFRYELATTKPYKDRGEKSDRDKYWKQYVSEYLIHHWYLQRTQDIEADDAVSILANRLEKADINYLIGSNDKDLEQVSGNHCNFSANGPRNFHYVDDYQASKFLAKQLITGDTIDNIPGLPRKGEKYADWAINLCNDVDELSIMIQEEYSTLPNADIYFKEQLGLLGLLTEYSQFNPEYYLLDQQRLAEYKSRSDDIKVSLTLL